MPNYMGKSPLRMKCPHCGVQDEHFVIQTDPANYHWGAKHVSLFERIAGADISYRKRTKRCRSCETEFETAELALHFLRALVGEVDRLTAELVSTEAERNVAIAKVINLQRAVDRAHASLVRHRSKQKT